MSKARRLPISRPIGWYKRRAHRAGHRTYRHYTISPTTLDCHHTALPFQKPGLRHWEAPRWYVVSVGTSLHAGIPAMPSINRAKLAIRIWERFSATRKARTLMLMLTVNPRNYSGCYGRYIPIAHIKALVRA